MASNRIGILLRQLPELQAVTHRWKRAAELQALLANVLPGTLPTSTSLSISETGELLLYAENGAVAAKLRQMTPRVLVFLRQRGIEVTGIRVQVQVTSRHNPLRQKQISLSPGGKQALASLAKRLENSSLRQALERMAGREDAASDHQKKPLQGIQGHENQQDDKPE